MKSIVIIILTLLFAGNNLLGQNNSNYRETTTIKVEKTIFACGADINATYIRYVVGLSKKEKPKVCFIPTAVYDDPLEIISWYEKTAGLNIYPTVLKTYVESHPSQQTFEQQLSDCDIIVVAGGSTLNMLAIWKAHGIDTLLKKAYDSGVILAGGSAGSVCWFTGGFTDSRPQALSRIECLGFLNYSHCPHYGNPVRKNLYEGAILNGTLKEGYAVDNLAGLLFVNGVVKKSVTLNKDHHNYFISVKAGQLNREELPAELVPVYVPMK